MTDRGALPTLMLVTSSATCGRPIADVAEDAARGGVDHVQVREDLPDGQLVALVARIVQRVHPHGTRVLVNDRPDVALAAGADGVHLKARGLDPRDVRALLERAVGPLTVGVAAHDAVDVAAAAAAGADYCTIGPLHSTPGKVPLGTSGLARVLDRARALAGRPLPIRWMVLGGVGADDLSTICSLALPGERWGVAAVRALQAPGVDAFTVAGELSRRMALLQRPAHAPATIQP